MQSDSYLFSPGIAVIPGEILKEKQKPWLKITRLLRDRYFWYVVILTGFVAIFKKLFAANWTNRLEHMLRFTVLALVEAGDATVVDTANVHREVANGRNGVPTEAQ